MLAGVNSAKDPLNPIQVEVEANPGKNTCKPLVGRTICHSCLQTMPESAALNRPNNRPNRHKNRRKAGNWAKPSDCRLLLPE